jgi:two-component system, NtrC family, response regulator
VKSRVLICEDDATQRGIIEDILRLAGHEVASVPGGDDALEALRTRDFDLLLTDLRMPEMSGVELLRQAKRLRPELEVVVMTAYATVETAVTAMKEGAVDYLAKPFDKDELLVVVGKALTQGTLRRENVQLRALVSEESALGNIIGHSPSMQRMYDVVHRAVPVISTVLIQGESGTGKELVARHIHFAGPRQKKPFIVVNCAALPDNLVESELFGHEKGAFTGADTSRAGKFEVADGGTIFLDEIGDMNPDSQAKLLRVLQDGIVERIGASQPREVDVRIIAATNRNLRELVDDSQFREDLYYRLEVLPLRLPPLRERIEDLPLLVDHFREKLSRKLSRPAPRLSADAIEAMRRYRWPGNVRELENSLEQLFILSDAHVVGVDALPEKLREPMPQSGEFALPPQGLVLEDLEQDLIRQALARSGGRIKEAADLLGLSYKTLQYRLKKHDIDRSEPTD